MVSPAWQWLCRGDARGGASSAGAPVKTVTVETIESSRRHVTVKKPVGNYEILDVPAAIRKFGMLKVGDQVDIAWTEAMVVAAER